MNLRVAVVTYNRTTYDSRVKRIVGALTARGHMVDLLSPDRVASIPGLAQCIFVPAIALSRADVLQTVAVGAAGSIVPDAAVGLHRLLPASRGAELVLRRGRFDAIHANDWQTLPAAICAARATGAQVVYDSHENAVEEHASLPWWRLTMPHSIAAIERKLIGEASHVITIGDGLAQTLRSRHGPRIRELTVVRNIPNASTSDVLSRSGGPLRLAYAGLLSPERRIEAMIVALVRLPAIWRLDVTGFGAESYLSTLRALCRSVGVADRVFWHPPAAPESLVERLSESDVGVFLSEGRNGQQRVALPNKIFEYTAAGLAVASAGSDEAGKLLAQHGHGIPLSGATAEALVAGLFGFDRARIDALRIQAAIARRELDWRKEQLRLLAVYDALKRVARSQ